MHRLPAAVITLLPALLACPGEGSMATAPPADSTAPAMVSFAADVQPIFSGNCALSGCHAGTAPQQGMNLSAGQAWQHIVNVPSNEVPLLMRVRPGLPDSSYLVFKIEGRAPVGGRMPLGNPPLPDSLIATIRAWIAAGAPDN